MDPLQNRIAIKTNWQKTIETWQNSGMSTREFYKAEGLQELTFYNWRKKLTDGQSQVNEQVLKNPSTFIKVALPESEHAFLELVLSSGSTLRISAGADKKTLSSVLSDLREVHLC